MAAILFVATALMFAVHSSLWLTLALLLVDRARGRAVRGPAARAAARSGRSGMLALGLVAGISLWWVSRYDGDAFFHLARVQKLLALHDLSLRSVDEFKDGGLHPGYAFPLWHVGRGGDLEARRRRRAVRLPAPADGAAAALVRARLRGRDGALRLALGGRRDRAGRVRAARARVRPRRRRTRRWPCRRRPRERCSCRRCSRSSSCTSASRRARGSPRSRPPRPR